MARADTVIVCSLAVGERERANLVHTYQPAGVGVVVTGRAETLVPAAKQTGYECEEATHSARCYSNYCPQREGERGCSWCWLE